jgi:uncharacterized repeat protein (TIGR01451 family)
MLLVHMIPGDMSLASADAVGWRIDKNGILVDTFSRWQTQNVDRIEAGAPTFYSQLLIDKAGHPHIAYYAHGNNNVKHAWFDDGKWNTEIVATSGNQPSLALDTAGHPHMAFTTSNQGLNYASYDGNNWHIERVVDGDIGLKTSLALDTANRPHISYYESTQQSLKYGYYDGQRWVVATVDNGDINGAGSDSSLALDAHNRPHIGYVQAGTISDPHIKLKYAWFDGSHWVIEVVDGTGASLDSSLALDRSGQPHISYYYDVTGYPKQSPRLRYAQRDTLGWHYQDIDSGGEASSIALDKSDRPHISYYQGHQVKYAWRDWIGWHVESIEQLGDWGQSSLALDSDDNVFVSYSYDKNQLKFAVRSPEADLSLSTMAASPLNVSNGEAITYTIQLINLSPTLTSTYVLTSTPPVHTTYLPGSAWASTGNITATNDISWSGVIDASSIITATFVVTADATLNQPTTIVNDATLVGDPTGPIALRAVSYVNGFDAFLPLISNR